MEPGIGRRGGTDTFADDGHRLLRRGPSAHRSSWSRPMDTDVCSTFARMPRQHPVSAARRGYGDRTNGSSRHPSLLVRWFEGPGRLPCQRVDLTSASAWDPKNPVPPRASGNAEVASTTRTSPIPLRSHLLGAPLGAHSR